jgi:hypothetical protein
VVDFVKGFGFLGVAWESWLFVGKAKVCECTVAWGRVRCGCVWWLGVWALEGEFRVEGEGWVGFLKAQKVF